MPRNIATGDDKPHEMRGILYVAPSQIILDPKFLAREKPVDDHAVASMVKSMRKFGQLQPIRAIKAAGDDGKTHLYAIFGATRTRAGCVLEEANPSFRLHVHVVKGVNEEDAFVMAVEENRQRNKTTPIDDALNARRLMGYGWDKTRVADLYGGISVQAVDNLLSLLSLPTPIRDRVRDGTLPAAVALEHLVGLPDAEAVAIVQDAEAAVMETQAAIPASEAPANQADGESAAQSGSVYAQLARAIIDGPPGSPEPVQMKTMSAKPPKVSKVGKNSQPKLTGRSVAGAARSRGHVTKRTWSEIRAVLEPRGDAVSRSIMEFHSGAIDERELDRVLDEAATAMRASEAAPRKSTARQPIRQLPKTS